MSKIHRTLQNTIEITIYSSHVSPNSSHFPNYNMNPKKLTLVQCVHIGLYMYIHVYKIYLYL